MSINTTTLPQNITPIKTITIQDLVKILPDTIPYDLNFWIGDKIARFGRTTDNLIFLVESDKSPSNEIMQFFNTLIAPLGINATVSNTWKYQKFGAVRLYNEGRLIVDKDTMTYKELPTPVYSAPILTIEEIMTKLPTTIDCQHTLYLTGGLVKNGWSANDADIIIFDKVEKSVLADLRNFFTNTLGWKTDVGQSVMTEREPVYLYKLYETGKLCQP